MTRISLISVEYCSLETPAMSAAPYAHQWHTKPNIFGLNLSPVVIRSQLLCQCPFGLGVICYSLLVTSLKGMKSILVSHPIEI